MSSGPPLELTLTGMAYGGDAFGKDENGRVVIVPFALPGERVRVDLTESHRGWARGRLDSILERAPQRIEPACRHYERCGGCHYQPITPDFQPALKAHILRDQFKRIGHFSNPPVLAPMPSPSAYATRNHVQFGLMEKGRLGLRAAGSHRLIPIDECHLPESALTGVWPKLRLEGISGIRRVSIRADSHRHTQVSLESDGPPPRAFHLHETDSAIWHAGGEAVCLQGEERLEFKVLGRSLAVASLSFFQVHSGLVNSLVSQVLEAMAVVPGDVVLDLFAGVGLFSVFLAKAGARVVAVEVSSHACADFRSNLEGSGSIVLHEGTAEGVLPSLPDRPQGVLVDPPGSGLAFGHPATARARSLAHRVCFLRSVNACSRWPKSCCRRLSLGTGNPF